MIYFSSTVKNGNNRVHRVKLNKDRLGGANVILKEDKTPPVIEQSFKTATKLKH